MTSYDVASKVDATLGAGLYGFIAIALGFCVWWAGPYVFLSSLTTPDCLPIQGVKSTDGCLAGPHTTPLFASTSAILVTRTTRIQRTPQDVHRLRWEVEMCCGPGGGGTRASRGTGSRRGSQEDTSICIIQQIMLVASCYPPCALHAR